MRKSIDNGLLSTTAQQEIDKKIQNNDRSLSYRRHSDVVESSKRDSSPLAMDSPVVPHSSKQSPLMPTAVPTTVSGGHGHGHGRASSTPPGPVQHTGSGPAWDISSLLSSQTSNTGGTGQDTGLGSLMYSVTTGGLTATDKLHHRHSMTSDSSHTSSTTHMNLSSHTSRTTTTSNTNNNSPIITNPMGVHFTNASSPHNRALPPFKRPSLRRALSLEGMGVYMDRGAPVMCKMPSAGKSFADIAGTG